MKPENKELLLKDLCARLFYSHFVQLWEKFDDEDSEYYTAGNVTSPAGMLTLGLAFEYTDAGDEIKLLQEITIKTDDIIVSADQDDPDNPDLNTYILNCNGKCLVMCTLCNFIIFNYISGSIYLLIIGIIKRILNKRHIGFV